MSRKVNRTGHSNVYSEYEDGCHNWGSENYQWQIQDFLRGGGRQPQRKVPQPIIWQYIYRKLHENLKKLAVHVYLPKTVWKWKNFDRDGVGWREGRQPQKKVPQPIIWQYICRKLRGNEKIGPRRGGGGVCASLAPTDPPPIMTCVFL